MPTLRMLRRRHCRCNLLLLLAVCAASATVLFKWGFMDAVKRSANMDDHAMVDIESNGVSNVAGEHDENVENMAPPVVGSPPEDKEEESEEIEKQTKIEDKDVPVPPQPKNDDKQVDVDAESSEIKSKEEEMVKPEEVPPKIYEENAPPHESAPEVPKEEAVPQRPEEEIEQASHGKSQHQQTDHETSQEQPPEEGESHKQAPKPPIPQKAASEEDVRGEQAPEDKGGLPEREEVGSKRVPSTLLEVLNAANTKPPKVAPESSSGQKEEVPNVPVHKTPQDSQQQPVARPTPPPVVETTKAPQPYELKRRLPQALLIGAVSCPVDVLVSFLHLHPDIVLGGVVNFFNDDVNYKRGLNWYTSQMPLSYPDQVTVDVNPTYYLAKQTPERIYQMNPNTKLLFVVCDPIMRALAHHVNSSQKEFDTLAFHSSKDGGVNERYEAIQYSLYFYHMQRWLKVFPKRQVLVVDVGTLRKNLHEELTSIENFLGVSPNILHIPANLDPAVMKKLQKFFQTHNEDFFKAIGRRFEWQ